MKHPLIASFCCHLIACLIYPILSDIGLQLYTALFGPPFARNVGIGLASQLVFFSFIFTNFIIVFISNIKLKIVVSLIQIACVLLYLLPQHPLRAVFFASISFGLTLLAITAANRLMRSTERR